MLTRISCIALPTRCRLHNHIGIFDGRHLLYPENLFLLLIYYICISNHEFFSVNWSSRLQSRRQWKTDGFTLGHVAPMLLVAPAEEHCFTWAHLASFFSWSTTDIHINHLLTLSMNDDGKNANYWKPTVSNLLRSRWLFSTILCNVRQHSSRTMLALHRFILPFVCQRSVLPQEEHKRKTEQTDFVETTSHSLLSVHPQFWYSIYDWKHPRKRYADDQ